MKFGRCVWLLVLIFIGIGLAGYGQQYGGTLTVALGGWPGSLDTHSMSTYAVRYFDALLFEKLVSTDHEFDVVPQMATSWETSEDGLTYTFHLRTDRVFHDGSACDAEDVKASLERFLSVSGRASSFAITAINVIDSYTVEIVNSRLTHLLQLLADQNQGMVILPAEIMSTMPGAGVILDEQLIGTGPYKLVERTMERITLARHDAYIPEEVPTSGYAGARTPYLDEIIFVAVPEAGARIAGLETGEYDFIENLSLADYDLVADNPDLEFDTIMAWMPIICFNVTNEPMGDIWLRRAINAAIGSDECMLAATFGHPEYANSTNASLFFEAQEKWATAAADQYWGEANPVLVAEYLAKSSYNGEVLTFITSKDYPFMFECAVVVQDQLKRVGINVELEVLEWSTAVARFVKDEDWHFFSTGFSPRAFPDAYQISLLSTGGLNARRTGWANAAIDALVEADQVTVDYETRYAIWEAITVLLRTYDLNHIKLGNLYSLNGRQNYVKGTSENYSISHFFGVWIEK